MFLRTLASTYITKDMESGRIYRSRLPLHYSDLFGCISILFAQFFQYPGYLRRNICSIDIRCTRNIYKQV